MRTCIEQVFTKKNIFTYYNWVISFLEILNDKSYMLCELDPSMALETPFLWAMIGWQHQFRQNVAWFKFRNILKNNGPEKREQTRIKSYVCQILYTGSDWLSIIYFSVWEKSTLSDWQTPVGMIIFLDDSFPTLVWPWNDLWPISVPLYAINWQSWIFVKMESQF